MSTLINKIQSILMKVTVKNKVAKQQYEYII